MDDQDAASIDMVRAFYQTWYRPDNATLVLCGAISETEAFRLADHYFGKLANPDTPRGVRATGWTLPPHSQVPRGSVYRDVPLPDLTLAWLTPPTGAPDDAALDVTAAVLTAGQSGRLYRDLVRERQAADSISAFGMGLSRGVSAFFAGGRPRPGHTTAEMEDVILTHLDSLAKTGPTDAELDRVLANAERNSFTSLAPVDDRADAINAAALLLGDLERVNTRVAELASVTPEDVARVAGTWLAPERRSVFEYRSEHDPTSTDGNGEVEQ
jgi:zinc protease